MGRSVGPLVRWSVRPLVRHTLLFRRLWGFWLYRSCPNAPLTSNMAPAHPHATGVAVYPALFFHNGYKMPNMPVKKKCWYLDIRYCQFHGKLHALVNKEMI